MLIENRVGKLPNYISDYFLQNCNSDDTFHFNVLLQLMDNSCYASI